MNEICIEVGSSTRHHYCCVTVATTAAELGMKLSEMKLFSGQIERVSMTELRKRPGDIIDQVQMGKTFEITKGGKHIATLSQAEPNALELGAEIRRMRQRQPEGRRE